MEPHNEHERKGEVPPEPLDLRYRKSPRSGSFVLVDETDKESYENKVKSAHGFRQIP